MHFAQTLSPNDAGWEYFDAAEGRYKIQPVRATVTVNGTDAYNAAAVTGLGLIQAPVAGLRPCFERGSLVQVMPAFTARPMPVSLVYVNRRQLAPRVLAVMNWLTEIVAPYFVDGVDVDVAASVPSATPAGRAAVRLSAILREWPGASPATDDAPHPSGSRRLPSSAPCTMRGRPGGSRS